MKIWMIWAMEYDDIWLVESWDDDSTMENPEGWERAVENARKSHKHIRITSTMVDFDKVRDAFLPKEV